MDKRSVKLHYIRGIHFVDKILNTALKNGYNKKDEYAFFEDASYKTRIDPLFMFDLNNFIFSCSVALIGLNKESIEKSDNCKNYTYDINYNIEHRKELMDRLYKNFKDYNTIETPYSQWLSVISVSANTASDNNYLFNVRNSLMHSEYDYEFDNDTSYNYVNVNLHNSNYTGFEGKLFIPYYLEFMKHYYSNDAYFGILSNLYVLSTKVVKAEKGKIDEYINGLIFEKYKYENRKESSRRIEKKMYKRNPKINESDFEKENIPLTKEDANKVKLIIEKYYGEEFYTYDKNKQGRLMIQVIKYIKDSKTVLSEWILHYYICSREAMRKKYWDEEFISRFACESSMLIVKSYLILYRMQNNNFEELNYDLMDDIDYEYDSIETYYTDFKNRLMSKGITISEKGYKKRYFCEIFRNSLAHGNISMDIRKEGKDIIQYVVLEDIYKGRVRKVTLKLEELKRFTNFEAFSRKEAKMKGSKPAVVLKR